MKVKPANQLVTVNGEIFNNVHIEKVEPERIIISYMPTRGGMAITKIYRNELSDEMRQRFGINPVNQ